MRYAWLLLLAIGCYEAPDYRDTRFKCNTENPCPAGQRCVNGMCGGELLSDANDGRDASDAMFDAGTEPNTVQCGTATCTSTQKCCLDFVNGPMCIAANAGCAGMSATCDGREDCGGAFCCGTIGTTTCLSSCGGNVLCRGNDDCPTGRPHCCPTTDPWGECSDTACP